MRKNETLTPATIIEVLYALQAIPNNDADKNAVLAHLPTVYGIIVHPDGTLETINEIVTYGICREVVGGYIELVNAQIPTKFSVITGEGELIAYCHEDERMTNKAPVQNAVFPRYLGTIIVTREVIEEEDYDEFCEGCGNESDDLCSGCELCDSCCTCDDDNEFYCSNCSATIVGDDQCDTCWLCEDCCCTCESEEEYGSWVDDDEEIAESDEYLNGEHDD